MNNTLEYDKDYTYITCVSPLKNSYKFYLSIKLNESNYQCKYGRIGNSNNKPFESSSNKWKTKYRVNTNPKKGYIDNSKYFDLILDKSNSTINTKNQFISNDKLVASLIQYLMDASNHVVKENYIISDDVLPNNYLFDFCTNILNDIRSKLIINCSIEDINKEYIKLLALSQRKIKNVNNALFSEIKDKDDLDKALEKIDAEYDLIDNLELDTKLKRDKIQTLLNDKSNTDTTQTENVLDTLGLDISIVDNNDIKLIKDALDYDAKNYVQAFKIVNFKQQKIYDKNYKEAKHKKTKLLWHGSLTQNYLSIIKTSLKIRPSGISHNGSMFSDGVYFASEADKSLGYTDCSRSRYVSGSNGRTFLLLFETRVGKQKIVTKHDSSCYNLDKTCKKDGFDSVHAKKGQSLHRDEYIIYDDQQTTPKYIVELDV